MTPELEPLPLSSRTLTPTIWHLLATPYFFPPTVPAQWVPCPVVGQSAAPSGDPGHPPFLSVLEESGTALWPKTARPSKSCASSAGVLSARGGEAGTNVVLGQDAGVDDVDTHALAGGAVVRVLVCGALHKRGLARDAGQAPGCRGLGHELRRIHLVVRLDEVNLRSLALARPHARGLPRLIGGLELAHEIRVEAAGVAREAAGQLVRVLDSGVLGRLLVRRVHALAVLLLCPLAVCGAHVRRR